MGKWKFRFRDSVLFCFVLKKAQVCMRERERKREMGWTVGRDGGVRERKKITYYTPELVGKLEL